MTTNAQDARGAADAADEAAAHANTDAARALARDAAQCADGAEWAEAREYTRMARGFAAMAWEAAEEAIQMAEDARNA